MKKIFSRPELMLLAQYITACIKDYLIDAIRESVSAKKEIMMPQDVAEMFHVKVDAIYKRCQREQIPYHKDTMGHIYFYKDEILNALSTEKPQESHL